MWPCLRDRRAKVDAIDDERKQTSDRGYPVSFRPVRGNAEQAVSEDVREGARQAELMVFREQVVVRGPVDVLVEEGSLPTTEQTEPVSVAAQSELAAVIFEPEEEFFQQEEESVRVKLFPLRPAAGSVLV